MSHLLIKQLSTRKNHDRQHHAHVQTDEFAIRDGPTLVTHLYLHTTHLYPRQIHLLTRIVIRDEREFDLDKFW